MQAYLDALATDTISDGHFGFCVTGSIVQSIWQFLLEPQFRIMLEHGEAPRSLQLMMQSPVPQIMFIALHASGPLQLITTLLDDCALRDISKQPLSSPQLIVTSAPLPREITSEAHDSKPSQFMVREGTVSA